MRRRTLLSLAAGAAVGRSSVSLAQWGSVPVIGFLGSGSPASYAPFVDAFRQGLAETGYVEGKTVADRISLGGQPL